MEVLDAVERFGLSVVRDQKAYCQTHGIKHAKRTDKVHRQSRSTLPVGSQRRNPTAKKFLIPTKSAAHTGLISPVEDATVQTDHLFRHSESEDKGHAPQ